MANFLPIPPTNAVSDPQARAALDALSQNIQIAIDTFATKGSVTSSSTAVATTVGNTYGNIVGSSVNNTPLAPAYTRAKLTQDLETGAASIISNGNTSDNIMKTGLNYIVFQNKNAIPLGSTGAYTGTVRTALGLLSTGIVGGYNDPSTGNWVSSITIDTSTGNLNVLGTIKANSIIQVGAYLGTDTVSTVLGNISTANSNAAAALAALTAKLNNSAADILSGPISFSTYGGFKTSGMTIAVDGTATGQGVAFTSKGIVGRNSTTTTFTIDSTTGDATFGGTLTAATGTFAGTVNSGNFVTSGGTIGTSYGANAWIAGTSGSSYTAGDSYFGGNMTIGGKLIVNGVFTTSGVNVSQYIGASATTAGLYVYNTGTTGGAAAFYNSTSGTFGLPTLFLSQGDTGPVLKAVNSNAGGNGSVFSTNQNYAFVAARFGDTAPVAWFQGPIALSLSDSLGTAWALANPSSTINAAGGGYYLAGDGAWHPVSGITAGVSSFNTRTGAVTLTSGDVTGALGFTPYSSSNPSGYVTSSGSVAYASSAGSVSSYTGYISQSQLIGSAPSSSYFLSGGGWSPVSVVNSLNGLTGSLTLTATFPGVGISSSGTNINIYQISDSSLKTNIQPIDLGLDFIRSLKPVTYNWNTTLMTFDKLMYGFIADDVIVATGGKESSIVYTHADEAGPLKGLKAVGTEGIVAALTKAVQELDIKVTLLESKNA